MNRKAFTLLELIIVIIIVGILATLGLTTYINQIEYSRVAEAKARIGAMRKLAYEYYLKNGTLDGIEDSDLGMTGCSSSSYFSYWGPSDGNHTSTWVDLEANRCTSGGKPPNASTTYCIYDQYYPGTSKDIWHCYTPGGDSCFGLPP